MWRALGGQKLLGVPPDPHRISAPRWPCHLGLPREFHGLTARLAQVLPYTWTQTKRDSQAHARPTYEAVQTSPPPTAGRTSGSCGRRLWPRRRTHQVHHLPLPEQRLLLPLGGLGGARRRPQLQQQQQQEAEEPLRGGGGRDAGAHGARRSGEARSCWSRRRRAAGTWSESGPAELPGRRGLHQYPFHPRASLRLSPPPVPRTPDFPSCNRPEPPPRARRGAGREPSPPPPAPPLGPPGPSPRSRRAAGGGRRRSGGLRWRPRGRERRAPPGWTPRGTCASLRPGTTFRGCQEGRLFLGGGVGEDGAQNHRYHQVLPGA